VIYFCVLLLRCYTWVIKYNEVRTTVNNVLILQQSVLCTNIVFENEKQLHDRLTEYFGFARIEY
jgi:hypothetical protein